METYKTLIETSFQNAENNFSKITADIISMEGMTGEKTRHFYNNLLNTKDARYLEIGTWKGSSVCSAMCNNKATVICIDNWSEFGGPKTEFLVNFEKFKGENDAQFIENDCYKVDVSRLPKFNIFMYDGNHTNESHYKALTHYYSCLDDVFIFIVDDWNWSDVRDGTINSIKKLNLKVLYEKEVRLTWDNSHTPQQQAKYSWWNGIYVAILQKNETILQKNEANFIGEQFRLANNWYNNVNINDYKEKPINYLEIGTYYGANLLSVAKTYGLHNSSKLYCIDPWEDYDEYPDFKHIQSSIYTSFISNVENSGEKDKIIIKRGFSHTEIPKFDDNFFDIIYIDGNHEPEYVLEDAILSFRKLKTNGIMIFDDYGWGGPDLTQRGIDGFLSGYHKRIRHLGQAGGGQVFIQKLR